MKNEYFILRHGHSKANEAKIILSQLEDGKLEEFTLTEKGEDQVRNSASKAKTDGALDETAIIISSPFSRCKRTAEIAREVLGVREPIIFDDRLRERWFGNWERKGNENYEKVWSIDKVDPNHKIELVESAQDVQNRTAAVIADCENKYNGKKIVLVSHGDALQILQTWFKKVSPARHRELTHLETAEIRKVN
jgi:probable phosphoglycerate mutase